MAQGKEINDVWEGANCMTTNCGGSVLGKAFLFSPTNAFSGVKY